MSDLSPKNKPIAFIGNGALAEQLKSLLQLSAEDYVVFDDHTEGDDSWVFPFDDYKKHIQEYAWAIALGYRDLDLKHRIYTEIKEAGGQFINYIHPSAFQSPLAYVDQGAFIYPMCNLDLRVSIGAQTLLNNSVVVSHDSSIGESCFLSPCVVISGNVKIGNCTFIGAGSIVANGVSIGKNVVVGIGTLVTKDIPANSFVIGNPMKFIERIELH